MARYNMSMVRETTGRQANEIPREMKGWNVEIPFPNLLLPRGRHDDVLLVCCGVSPGFPENRAGSPYFSFRAYFATKKHQVLKRNPGIVWEPGLKCLPVLLDTGANKVPPLRGRHGDVFFIRAVEVHAPGLVGDEQVATVVVPLVRCELH